MNNVIHNLYIIYPSSIPQSHFFLVLARINAKDDRSFPGQPGLVANPGVIHSIIHLSLNILGTYHQSPLLPISKRVKKIFLLNEQKFAKKNMLQACFTQNFHVLCVSFESFLILTS